MKKTFKIIVGAFLVIIGLQVAVLLIAVVWIAALNETNGSIVSSGVKRDYLLYVPNTYDRNKPTPLVISIHGAMGWPAQQMNLTHWNRLADEYGFVVVYPSGSGMPRVWNKKDADVRFVSELIDTLQTAYYIDPTRIYANGFSNGGGMTFDLSCKLSHRIAAVATVAPALFAPSTWCADARPMPLISFHGTADEHAPYNGGPTFMSPPGYGPMAKRVPFASVSTWAKYWAGRNRCGPNPVESVITTDVARIEYPNCAESAPVVVYTIKGGGHSWPGGKAQLPDWVVGPTGNSIDASSQMWAFFRQHQLVRP